VVDKYSIFLCLRVGDVVYDKETKEFGILLRKINLLDSLDPTTPEVPSVNAWEIMWSGSELRDSSDRVYIYTESGLINMIREGLLSLYQNN